MESIREPIVLPVPAITEVAYLLARDIGNDAAADFISSLADTELILEAPLAEDYLRSAEILRQYADANLDFVDALIAATAERLNRTPVPDAPASLIAMRSVPGAVATGFRRGHGLRCRERPGRYRSRYRLHAAGGRVVPAVGECFTQTKARSNF